MVCSVANGDGRLAAFSAVDPDAVGRSELAFALAGAAELGDPVAVLVVAVNPEGTVAIGEEETSVVEKSEVGGKEGIASPALYAHFVLVLSVDSAVHWSILFPNCLALEGEFSEGLYVLVGADVEELLAAFLAYLDAVSSSLELTAEGSNKFSCGIKYEDGGVILEVGSALVDDIEVACLVESYVVGGLPSELFRKFRPIMMNLVAMLALAYYEVFGVAFFSCKDGWNGQTRRG